MHQRPECRHPINVFALDGEVVNAVGAGDLHPAGHRQSGRLVTKNREQCAGWQFNEDFAPRDIVSIEFDIILIGPILVLHENG